MVYEKDLTPFVSQEEPAEETPEKDSNDEEETTEE